MGTQDNNTQGSSSRTFRTNGISNADWYVFMEDEHQPATEPGNPDIVYAQLATKPLSNRQNHDESIYIKPQSGVGEPYERYNWDAPILVSHHDPKRLYF